MRRIFRLSIATVLGLVSGAVLLASLLPFLDTEWWGIRLLGFPRLQ